MNETSTATDRLWDTLGEVRASATDAYHDALDVVDEHQPMARTIGDWTVYTLSTGWAIGLAVAVASVVGFPAWKLFGLWTAYVTGTSVLEALIRFVVCRGRGSLLIRVGKPRLFGRPARRRAGRRYAAEVYSWFAPVRVRWVPLLSSLGTSRGHVEELAAKALTAVVDAAILVLGVRYAMSYFHVLSPRPLVLVVGFFMTMVGLAGVGLAGVGHYALRTERRPARTIKETALPLAAGVALVVLSADLGVTWHTAELAAWVGLAVWMAFPATWGGWGYDPRVVEWLRGQEPVIGPWSRVTVTEGDDGTTVAVVTVPPLGFFDRVFRPEQDPTPDALLTLPRAKLSSTRV